jgi:hypothetical protein
LSSDRQRPKDILGDKLFATVGADLVGKRSQALEAEAVAARKNAF